MTIAAITSIATSGMQAQSTYLTATANNVANAMTPGYKQLDTSFATTAGGGVSAEVKESSEQTVLTLMIKCLALCLPRPHLTPMPAFLKPVPICGRCWPA